VNVNKRGGVWVQKGESGTPLIVAKRREPNELSGEVNSATGCAQPKRARLCSQNQETFLRGFVPQGFSPPFSQSAIKYFQAISQISGV
jgi:hypothetical protein